MKFEAELERTFTTIYFDLIETLHEEIQDLQLFLIEKNKKYGNSALQPVRRFAKSDAVEQLRVRIDDKLSRLIRGNGDDEDTKLDLLGYLILEKIAGRYGKGTD